MKILSETAAWGDSTRPGALPHRFVKAYPGGHRDIQAFNTAQHRQVYQQIASIAGQASQSPFLTAHDDADRTAEVSTENSDPP